jgi:hypothetical protein
MSPGFAQFIRRVCGTLVPDPAPGARSGGSASIIASFPGARKAAGVH